MKNLVVAEILKSRFNQAKSSNLFFYRDRTGNEVDLIIQNALTLTPVEIKSSQTANLDFCRTLRLFRKLFPTETKNALVIYGGDERFTHHDATFLPWKNLSAGYAFMD